jgi:predicted amidohydrolase YtcJ
MAVLSEDIFTMPKDRPKDVKFLKTIAGGNVVYETK